MKSFPAEFVDLLSTRGRRILDRGLPESDELFWRRRRTPIVVIPGVIAPRFREPTRRLLDRSLLPHVTSVHAPIPRETITELEHSGLETLPKTLRFKSTVFSRNSRAASIASDIGLLEMMRSESFAGFTEAVTRYELEPDPGLQAVLYGHGDYVGPHNDHHPEIENEADGYVDMHLMFSNDDVASQSLVCEEDGYLQREYDSTCDGAVAIYRLPFWHYTTPLRAKPGRESSARRWLLLATFDICWDPED